MLQNPALQSFPQLQASWCRIGEAQVFKVQDHTVLWQETRVVHKKEPTAAFPTWPAPRHSQIGQVGRYYTLLTDVVIFFFFTRHKPRAKVRVLSASYTGSAWSLRWNSPGGAQGGKGAGREGHCWHVTWDLPLLYICFKISAQTETKYWGLSMGSPLFRTLSNTLVYKII